MSTSPIQNSGAYPPTSSDITEFQPAVEFVHVMNMSAAISTSSMTGRQKWNFLSTPTRLNSSACLKMPMSSTDAAPVDMADTRNRMGSSALFHSGNVLHTPSRAPVYMATATPNTTPAISSHTGTRFFMKSRTTTTSDITVKPPRNTTPQVMTDPKFVSSRAKRSGFMRPAFASNISKHRPMITTIGATRCPILRIDTASGCRHPRKAEVTNAPPPRPARNRYHAMMAPQIGSNVIVHHLT